MPRTQVLKRSSLPPGSRKIIEKNGFEITLFNLQGKIHAISNICPHNGGSLGEGILAGEMILCPLHFWKFDLNTGRSINQPAVYVETYPVAIENGWIYLDLPEEDLEE